MGELYRDHTKLGKILFYGIDNRRSCHGGPWIDRPLGILFAIFVIWRIYGSSRSALMDDFPWIYNERRRTNGFFRLFDGASIWRELVQIIDVVELGANVNDHCCHF